MEFLAFLKLFFVLHVIKLVVASPVSVPLHPAEASIENEESKVFNGSKAETIYPFLVTLVQVQSTSRDNIYILCGGSLIDPTHVLTAAHCVDEIAPKFVEPWSIEVWIATSSIKPPKFEQKIVIPSYKNINFHPNFTRTPSSLLNDIAVITLPTAATINDKVSTACIGDLDNYNELDVTVAGYGYVDCKITFANVLQHAVGKSLDGERCDALYRNPGFASFTVCAFLKNAKGEYSSTAQGDSGGPLFIVRDNEYIQIGVVSANVSDKKGCPKPEYPSIYCNPRAYKKYLADQGAKPRYCT